MSAQDTREQNNDQEDENVLTDGREDGRGFLLALSDRSPALSYSVS